jgi:cytochrome bd-type quinol oxidase subunit 2
MLIGALVVVFIIMGTVLDVSLNLDYYLACGIGMSGAVVLIGLLYHADMSPRPTADGVRDALAVSFFLVYLLLVIFSVYSAGPVDQNGHPVTNPETTKALLGSFSSVATVVVSAYFVTGSVDKFTQSRRATDGGKSNATDQDKDQRQDATKSKDNTPAAGQD